MLSQLPNGSAVTRSWWEGGPLAENPWPLLAVLPGQPVRPNRGT